MKRFLSIHLFVYLLLCLFVSRAIADVTAGSSTTVAVPPTSSNYQLITTDDVGPGPVSQGTDMNYTITYGASSSAIFTAGQTTLTVDYSEDTLDGVTNVADYVYGSATNAYGGTQPIVDTVNRTITWNISQLPAGAYDQIVTFKMKTNSSYTGSNQVPIVVKAQLTNQYANLTSSYTTTYGYHISPPGPTATPTPSPTPRPTVTPTITQPAEQPLAISSVNATEITSNSMTLNITTTKKTRLRTSYGLDPNTRLQSITDDNLKTIHSLKITGLNPSTSYYFQFILSDENFNSITSDLFIFKTAKSSAPIVINPAEVTLVGSGSLIATQTLSGLINSLLSTGQVYSIALHLPPASVKSIAAIVTTKVLAANTFDTTSQPEIATWSVPLREKSPGFYVTELSAPPTTGSYEISIRLQDTNGNIVQSKIAEITVYGPFHVLDKITKKPIDHALLFLSEYNDVTKRYEQNLYSQTQQNPFFTNKNGLADLVTGEGKYKVYVSQFGYKSQTVAFTLNAKNPTLPTIELQPNGFSPVDNVKDTWQTVLDFKEQLTTDLQNISSTSRFFNVVSMLVIASLIMTTFLLFLIRTRLSLLVIPLFIKHHTQKAGSVQGQIVDAITRRPIAMAVIAISNKFSHEILTTITSNNKGIFYLKSAWVSSENNMNILAQGYRTNKFAINEDLFPAVIYLHHNLVGGPLHHPFVASLISLAGSLFETLLVVSLILEIFFIPTIGLLSLVFVGLSLFNVFLWILYHREKILF